MQELAALVRYESTILEYNSHLTPLLGPLLDITLEQAQKTYETNVFGLMRIVHAVVPRMAERKKGLIVVVGSIRSEMSTPFSGIYSSSKAAVRTYTETLSMECQPLGVDVMLINPGSVTSNIVKVNINISILES